MTKKESSTVQKSRLKSNDKQLCWAKPCRSSMFAGKLEDEIIGLQSSLQVPGKEELSFANTVLFTLCFHLKRRDGRREGLLSERFVLVDAAMRVLYFLWACVCEATKAAFGQKTTCHRGQVRVTGVPWAQLLVPIQVQPE